MFKPKLGQVCTDDDANDHAQSMIVYGSLALGPTS